MDKICAIALPFVVLGGGLFALSNVESVRITNWPLLIGILFVANAILALKIMLSDYVKKFEMGSHSLQLTEMALTAFLATIAIQIFNTGNIFQQSIIAYPFLNILTFGLAVTVITTAVVAIIIKKVKNKEWPNNVIIISISYLIGLAGYSLYVLLFLLKVVSK